MSAVGQRKVKSHQVDQESVSRTPRTKVFSQIKAWELNPNELDRIVSKELEKVQVK